MVAELHAIPSDAVDDAVDAPPEPQIIRLSTKRKTGDKEKRLPLFYIDDRMYTIRAKATPSLALRYMHTARLQGLEAAIDLMLGELLGEEGYTALMAYEDLEVEDLQAIITKARTIMQGPVDAPKGTPQPA